MSKIIIFLCFLCLTTTSKIQATVWTPSAISTMGLQKTTTQSYSKTPKTPAQKWAKAGLIVLLIIGIALILLGLVLFGLLIQDGFDGGHLGYIPTVAAAVILGLGLLSAIFSAKRIKKLNNA